MQAEVFRQAGFASGQESTGVSVFLGLFKLVTTGCPQSSVLHSGLPDVLLQPCMVAMKNASLWPATALGIEAPVSIEAGALKQNLKPLSVAAAQVGLLSCKPVEDACPCLPSQLFTFCESVLIHSKLHVATAGMHWPPRPLPRQQ